MQNDKLKFKYDFENRIYQFVSELIKFVNTLPSDSTSRIIKEQLIRSGTSVGANYVESSAASSKKDFINFLNHSLKSANESKFWLRLSKDSGKATSEDIKELLQELSEIANILASSILTLKGRR